MGQEAEFKPRMHIYRVYRHRRYSKSKAKAPSQFQNKRTQEDEEMSSDIEELEPSGVW